MPSAVRTFVAIPISPPTALRLADARERLRLGDAGVQWVDPAQYHLTLRFLGEIGPSDVAAAVDAVRKSLVGLDPFALGFRGVGAFPDWKRPRVIWARVAQGKVHVKRLADSVGKGLVEAGFPPSSQPFRPHLTLGRVKEPQAKAGAGAAGAMAGLDGREPADAAFIEAGPECVERVVVYESRLTPRGPRYIERGVLRLGGEAESPTPPGDRVHSTDRSRKGDRT